MQAAIVDDSSLDRDNLVRYIDEYAKSHDADIEPIAFPDATSFLREDSSQFSLVFFDIDMPGISGMEAARLLRSVNPDITIVFVTSMPQYALEGYEVEAADYLVKPISYPTFSLKLTGALARVQERSEQSLVIKTADGMVILPVRDVLYIESHGHYLMYHTARETYRTRETMTACEKKLESSGFARCNSYYLVNLKQVKAISGSSVKVGTDELAMSRSRREAFTEAFIACAGGI